MDLRRRRIFFGLAEAVVILAAIFLLLDAVLGFTRGRQPRSAQSQPVSQNTQSANLSTSCTGGFSNKRTVNGVTQVAPRGTPFNAYEVTLTNLGGTVVTVRSMSVELVNGQHEVFARHRSVLDGGITLHPGQSRRIVEAYGIGDPVASCRILSWRP